jgi:uncharacterized membrane protein HdeD (DUF308 family)
MPETILPTFSSIARRVWYWTVVRGVLAVIFGVVALVAPITTAASLAVVVAVFAIADGLVEIVDGIRHRGHEGAGLRILQGALTLVFGVVLVVWPAVTALVIVWTIGLWAVVVGIIQVVVALSLRRVVRSGWGWGLVSGLVSVIFGVLLLARPDAGLVSIIWVLGVYAIMIGVLLIGFGLQVRRLGTEAGKVAEGRASGQGADRADRRPAGQGDAPSAARPEPDRAGTHLAAEGQASPTPTDATRDAEHVPSHLAAPAAPAASEAQRPDAPA